MPLKSGSSQGTISHNIREMVDSWKRRGKIGNSRPRSKKAAIKQAVAISLKKARKSSSRNKHMLIRHEKAKHPSKKPAAEPPLSKNNKSLSTGLS